MSIIKKYKLDKRYLKISGYALAIIILTLISNNIINNFPTISNNFRIIIRSAASLLAPFLYGFFIAFFLNAPVRFFEQKVYARIKGAAARPKLLRVLSIATVFLIFLLLLFWLLTFAFPEIVSGFQGFINATRQAIYALYGMGFGELEENELLMGVLEAFNGFFNTGYTVRNVLDQVLGPVLNILNTMPVFLGQVYLNLISVMTNLLNFILGLILSIYMLYDKDNIKRRIVKLLKAFFREETVKSVSAFALRANNIVERYTVGTILDSAMMGLIFFLVCVLMRLPYPLLLAIIFGVTNLIPYFGPIAGGVVVSVLVMFQDPVKGLWTGVVVLILQQVDGNIIAPKILGDSTGLKPLSVIFSILVGGAFFGVPGMFFGAPVFAVVATAFSGYIDRRSRRRAQMLSAPPAEPDAEEDAPPPDTAPEPPPKTDSREDADDLD